MTTTIATADCFLDFPEVKRRTNLSRPTIWRLERAGKFPRRRLIGTNRVAWSVAEITAWMASRPQVGSRPPGTRTEDRTAA